MRADAAPNCRRCLPKHRFSPVFAALATLPSADTIDSLAIHTSPSRRNSRRQKTIAVTRMGLHQRVRTGRTQPREQPWRPLSENLLCCGRKVLEPPLHTSNSPSGVRRRPLGHGLRLERVLGGGAKAFSSRLAIDTWETPQSHFVQVLEQVGVATLVRSEASAITRVHEGLL